MNEIAKFVIYNCKYKTETKNKKKSLYNQPWKK